MGLANYLFKFYLEAGEEILNVFHRHPFVMVADIGKILFIGFAIPLFLYFLFPQFVLLFVIWMIISAVRIMYVVLNWYYDSLLITNVSLIDVQWEGFFDRSSARLEYPMIEGITCETKGVIQTVFNFGLVSIQRAGGTHIDLQDAINPRRVERKIMAYQETFATHQGLKDSETLKTLLTNMLRHHAKTEGLPEEVSE